MKKKILLTGGNGFIGKNLQESFLSQKYDITAPRSFELNLTDTDAVDAYFKDKEFDVILHSATKPGHRNAKDLSNLFYTNTRMFFNLARQSKKFGKLINFGSGAVYDMQHYEPKMKEEYFGTHIPEDEHGFSKYVINKFIEKENKFIDLRILGIYGKYEDYQIRFISNAVCKALYGMPITIKQDRKFDYTWVGDMPAVLEFFIESAPKYNAYNITPDNSVQLSSIAQQVREIVHNNVEIIIKNDGLGLEYSADNSRLKAEFAGYKQTSITEGIKALASYYKQNLDKINAEYLKTDK